MPTRWKACNSDKGPTPWWSPVHVSTKQTKPSGKRRGKRKYPELALKYMERCSPHHTVRDAGDTPWGCCILGQAGRSHSCRGGQVGGIFETHENSCLWLSIPCSVSICPPHTVCVCVCVCVCDSHIRLVVTAEVGHWLSPQWNCEQCSRRLGFFMEIP